MSSLPAQRRSRPVWPDIEHWFADFSPWAGLRPVFGTHVMRLEDEMKDGRYEIRAEIPGVDPAKDIEITVHDGQLTIKAERSEKKESKSRSEFSYGSFVRTVSLPTGADENDITATYNKGILTVSVGLSEPKPAEKHIQVQSSN
jgi:HSP20 family protein